MNLLQKSLIVIGLAASAALAYAAAESLETRIAPVGELCMAGEACAAAIVAVSAEPRSGEQVYSSKCLSCHGTGAAGAPKFGDAGDWQARIDARGVDALHMNAWQGYNAMPAKGLCMDCTEAEIYAAVDYILENL